MPKLFWPGTTVPGDDDEQDCPGCDGRADPECRVCGGEGYV